MINILTNPEICIYYFILVISLYLTIQYYICEIQYTDYSKPKEGEYNVQYNFSIFLGVYYTLFSIFIILIRVKEMSVTTIKSFFMLFLVIGVISSIYSYAKITGDRYYKNPEENYFYSNGYKIIYTSNDILFLLFIFYFFVFIINTIYDNCCQRQNRNNYYRTYKIVSHN